MPLVEGLDPVRARLERACARAGRDVDSVRLVAVTKSVGTGHIRELVARGVRDLGENRVAQLVERRDELRRVAPDADVRWHMIGHVQRRKVRRLLSHCALLHAGDRLRLLDALQGEAQRAGSDGFALLLQVNVSGETQKGGLEPDALWDALDHCRGLDRLAVTGLMTMAPRTDDPEETRPVFAALRGLRDEAARRGYLEVRELSMGMTDDFEIAVEEGATIVRIGRALFSAAGS